MSDPTFTFLGDAEIWNIISRAQRTVIYAAPSISSKIANAFAQNADAKEEVQQRIILDADSESFRLGFGDIDGLTEALQVDVDVRKARGLRIGVLVVDEEAWVFAPTPEIIFDQPTAKIRNAVRVSKDFAQQILVSIAPDLSFGQEPLDLVVIPDSAVPEIGQSEVTQLDLRRIITDLEKTPPQKFDLTRKVRVFQAYLQFVDIHLEKGSLQTHRIAIPQGLLEIVTDPEVRARMIASYRLLDKASEVVEELKGIKAAVDMLREDFTQSVGKKLGRVLRRSEKEKFEVRVSTIRKTIEKAKEDLQARLTNDIKKNCKQLSDVLAPTLAEKPSTPLQYALGEDSHDAAAVFKFLMRRLMPSDSVISNLVTGMNLEVVYKDLTFEMLKDEEFIERLRNLFPDLKHIHVEEDAIKEKPNNS